MVPKLATGQLISMLFFTARCYRAWLFHSKSSVRPSVRLSVTFTSGISFTQVGILRK